MSNRQPLALAIAALVLSTSAHAITDTESLAGAQFNFANPGARSLAMGGAFIALADDATAAIANPAGLMQLSSTQVSFEIRASAYDTPFVSGGSYSINPLNRSNLTFGSSSERENGIGFAAFTRPGERFSWSIFYHQLGAFSNNLANSGVRLTEFSPTAIFIDPYTAQLEYKVAGFGAAAATKLGDKFLIGFNVASYTFDFDSRRTQFSSALPNQPVRNTISEKDTDSRDLGFGVGILFKPTDEFSIGLNYSRAPEFEYQSTLTDTQNNRRSALASFNVPGRFSVGAAYRASEALTFSFEASRIEYSTLAEKPTSAFVVQPDFEADNGTELRLGLEYVLLNMQRPLSLRAGVWRDPAHRVFARDPRASNIDERAAQSINWALFTPGKDQTHGSLGFGWAFETFQLDFGADFSKEYDTFAVSGVWRF